MGHSILRSWTYLIIVEKEMQEGARSRASEARRHCIRKDKGKCFAIYFINDKGIGHTRFGNKKRKVFAHRAASLAPILQQKRVI